MRSGHTGEGDRVAQVGPAQPTPFGAAVVETADGLKFVKASGAANALLNRFERLQRRTGLFRAQNKARRKASPRKPPWR
jgi:hypothetical protein